VAQEKSNPAFHFAEWHRNLSIIEAGRFADKKWLAGYDLAIKLYLKSSQRSLPSDSVERIILATAMEAYDGATNGNKTRGGMKKANDM
jgi:hypothetical protein